MDPQPDSRLARAEALFLAALDLDPDERVHFLDAACAGEDALRAEVASLLDAHHQADAFFERSPAAPPPRTRLGPYALLRELGRGGMGTVYLARRDDDAYQQLVAIKMMQRGTATPALRARFRAERHILARLQHPHIARLLDGGVSDDGSPYFVMEYVEGVPLTQYCDRERLSVSGRLRLFMTVCEAVHAAHQNLIVHRDLKPSNILVTPEGTVKLLDFGIAKLLDAEALPVTAPMTRTGLRVMTPEYAAPEQVRGEPVTTAADVYALGVLLYELLTGRRPYRLPGRLLHEIERIICEAQPERPSTAVSRVDDAPGGDGAPSTTTPEAVSAARSTQAEKLRRRLAGDLDNIVLMAMRKEPGRRYASAEQFREDLARHLDGRPVAARKDTAGYRVAKFVRRHRGSVAMAAGAVLFLVGFSLFTLAQSREIARERDRATRVTTFLVDLFRQADPDEAEGETLTARALLDRGAARVADELADQPHTEAELAGVMREVYGSLGYVEEARRFGARAVALQAMLFGEADPRTAAARAALADFHRRAGDYAAAESLLTGALALQAAGLGPDALETVRTRLLLGQLLHDRGQYAAAEPHLRDALARRRVLLPPGDPEVVTALNNLARLLEDMGRYDAAEPLFEEALAVRRRTLGPLHPRVAVSLNNLGLLRYRQGQAAAADSLLSEALALRRRTLDADHPRIAVSLNNLALVRQRQQDFAAAGSLYTAALAINRARLGDDHPRVAATLHSLGRLALDQGDFGKAEQFFRRALVLRETRLGPDHPDVAKSLTSLADLFAATSRFDEAEAHYRDALGRTRRALGNDHPAVAVSANNLGVLLEKRRRLADAEPLFREALAINRRVLGPRHPTVASNLNNVAHLLKTRRQYPEADSLFREVLALQRDALGPEHTRLATTLTNLATVQLQGFQNHEAAEDFYRQALAIQDQRLAPDHPHIARTLSSLAFLQREQKNYAAAEANLTRALDIYTRHHGTEHEDVAYCLHHLGVVHLRRGDAEKAEGYLRRALGLRERLVGAHPRTAFTLATLGDALRDQGRYAEAEPYYVQSLDQLATFKHPALQPVRASFIKLYEAWGKPAAADRLRALNAG